MHNDVRRKNGKDLLFNLTVRVERRKRDWKSGNCFYLCRLSLCPLLIPPSKRRKSLTRTLALSKKERPAEEKEDEYDELFPDEKRCVNEIREEGEEKQRSEGVRRDANVIEEEQKNMKLSQTSLLDYFLGCRVYRNRVGKKREAGRT